MKKDTQISYLPHLENQEPILIPLDDIEADETSLAILRIITDESEFLRFIDNPNDFLQQEFEQDLGVDVQTLTELVIALKLRSHTVSQADEIPKGSVRSKVQIEQAQYNFDHSQYVVREVWLVAYRGMQAHLDKTEAAMQYKDFRRDGFNISKDKVMELINEGKFFPGQPLVTPALIQSIKDSLAVIRQ